MTTSKPLNVLLLIDSLRMGGAERVTVALLPYLDPERVRPTVCTLHTRRESPLAQQLGTVPRIDLGVKRLLDPIALRRLLRIIDNNQIDLIHVQLQDATVFAAFAKRFKGVPVVVTRHLIDDDTSNWRRRMRNRVERVAIRYGVDRIITVSDAARDNYMHMTGLPRERFHTIYNGIDVKSFGPAADKHARRKALGLPLDAPLITMVGVMRSGKGQDVAIDAARQMQGVHFLLVGDGKPHHRAALEERAQGLEDRVHFLGQRMDVPDVLSASDMLILPSDNEALPTVLIEAGASGLPVVATRVGGIPEIVEDGVTGLIIPPRDPDALADAIRRLFDDPALAKSMGERANERVRRIFTLVNQAEATMNFYETVVVETRNRQKT